MHIPLMFQNQNRFKQMLLNLSGHSLSISIFCFTPPPLLGWRIILTGASTQSQFISHTAVSQCELFTLLSINRILLYPSSL